MIEYRGADGTTKTMRRAELEERLRRQQEEGPPQMGPDGKLTKQQEGRATVEEVGLGLGLGSDWTDIDRATECFDSTQIQLIHPIHVYTHGQLREKDPFLARVVDAAKYAIARCVLSFFIPISRSIGGFGGVDRRHARWLTTLGGFFFIQFHNARLEAEGAVGVGARLKSLHSLDDDEGIEVGGVGPHALTSCGN